MRDKEIKALLEKEAERQESGLELIPSENYVSGDVRNALSSVLTNKYSEGYPGRRYYGGQEVTDAVEQLAIDRAIGLFGADHANVQPHSGAQANEAAYHAWLEPGDTVLAMALDQGGHLTHGHPVTMLAGQYRFIRYGIVAGSDDGAIDYDALFAQAKKYKPKIILAGFSSYPRELDYSAFRSAAEACGALLVADIAHIAGLIVGGALKNPFDYGFHVMTSTTHKTLRGPRGGLILSRGTVSNPLKAPEKTKQNIPTLIDRSVFPGIQGGPHMHSIAAKAVCFYEAGLPEFRQYAAQVINNARRLAAELINHGCKLVTNGTDNHLMLIDVMTSFGFDGSVAEKTLETVGLNANKNAIPFDAQPPFRPSGLRLGTPAITTRGLDESDMVELAELIVRALRAHRDDKVLAEIRSRVGDLARQHPIP